MAATKSVKVGLSPEAAAELEKIAQKLGLSQAEVLRRGLSIMRVYSEKTETKDDVRKTPNLFIEAENDPTQTFVLNF